MQQQANMLADCDTLNLLQCTEDGLLLLLDGWFQTGLGAALLLFPVLAGLELVVSGYMMIKREGNVNEVLKLLVAKLMLFMLVWLLLQWSAQGALFGSSLNRLPLLWSEDAAEAVTGQAIDLTFAKILKIGLDMFGAIMKAPVVAISLNPFTIAPEMAIGFLLGVIVGLLLFGACVRLAIEVLKATLECYFVAGGGVILLGFLSFRGTAPLGEGYLRYLVEVALKLFFITLLVVMLLQILESLQFMIQAWATREATAASPGDAIKTILILGVISLLLHGLIGLPAQLAGKISSGITINVKAILEKL